SQVESRLPTRPLTIDSRLPTAIACELGLGICSQAYTLTDAVLALVPVDERAGRRVRADLRAPLERARPQQTHRREVGALRVRDAAGRRRARAPVGQVLPGRDDLPALRHRGRVS